MFCMFKFYQGELFLIIFIHCLWIIVIIIFLERYKNMTRNELSTTSCNPMNIERSNLFKNYYKIKNYVFFEKVEIVKNEQDAVIYGKKRVDVNIMINENVAENIDDNFSKISNVCCEEKEKIELRRRHRTSSLPDILNIVDENKKRLTENLYSVNNFKKLILKNTNERAYTREKMNHFAKTQRPNKNRNLYEKRILYSQKSRFSSEKSQERSQLNSQDRSRDNSLSPDMIPLQVQRVLLELHARSKANLSKSESILDRKRLIDTRILNGSQMCLNIVSRK